MNGKKAPVTSNALQVLENISSYWFPKLVWIDSLCINQSDSGEKAKQVQMMHRIYQSAFHVSICLVQESQAQLLKYWSNSKAFRQVIREEPTAWEENLANYIVASMTRNLLEDLQISNLHETVDGDAIYGKFGRRSLSSFHEALYALFTNPWFDRIWVVQEVALARRIHVKYGEVDFDWSVILDGMSLFGRYTELAELLRPRSSVVRQQKIKMPTGIPNMAVMESIHSKVRNGEDISLGYVLTFTRFFQSTDARDRVFALHGLCSDLPKSLMLPNYEAGTSFEHVYIDAAQAIVEAGDGARVLALSGIGYFEDSCSSSLTLPSWVPNWTRMSTIPQLAFTRLEIDYNAGGSQPLRSALSWGAYNTAIKPSKQDFESAYSIFIDGYACSTIVELADPWIVPNTAGKDLSEEADRLIQLAKLFFSSFKLVTNSRYTKVAHVREGLLEASFTVRMIEIFWRTTMGNRTLTVNPAPANLVEKFIRFVKIAKDILEGIISPAMDPRGNASLTDIKAYAPITEYVNLTFPCWAHRRICVTSEGQVGMVPRYARVGDEVVVFPGMQTPLVIRALPRRILQKYQIIGECYVHGLMNQEVFSLGNPRKIYEII
jgi:hypothetical protein